MTRNDEARKFILGLIRNNLAASAPHVASEPDRAASARSDTPNSNRNASSPLSRQSPTQTAARSVVDVFAQNLESVDGHCIIVNNESELDETVKRLTEQKRIADPNASRSDLFNAEVGVTSAQAAIAETGTLVLDSSVERNRLVSLVPPVHIATLNASQIYSTLSEALSALQSGEEVSPTITFITGPSRTADIELTLAIGVHGPQELYVIIRQDK
jgi:L-lactate utilization protein LutC